MRSVIINSQYYVLINYDEIYDEKINFYKNVAVTWTDGKIYPIAKSPTQPGIYFGNNLFGSLNDDVPYKVGMMVELPDCMSDNKDIKDIIADSEASRDIAFEQIATTDADNIFSPAITGNETVEMRMLKDAIIAKNIDINKYESRFKGKFQNDKRLLNKDSISLDKLKGIAEALDLEVAMIIRDKNNKVPNPMNKEFDGVITHGEEE